MNGSYIRPAKKSRPLFGKGLERVPINEQKHFTYMGQVCHTELEVKKRDSYYHSIPSRDENGTLIFPGWEDKFAPNLTPAEMFHRGSFGGTYWRPIYSAVTKTNYDKMWLELPQCWLEGLDIRRQVANNKYDNSVNMYACPKDYAGPHNLDTWEKNGWIKTQDPYGWVMWYCRFYLGRRTEDDARQIQRWYNFAGAKGRKRRELVRMIHERETTFDDYTVDPKTRQGLQHWAYVLNEYGMQQVVDEFDKNGWPTGPVGDNQHALNQQRDKKNRPPKQVKKPSALSLTSATENEIEKKFLENICSFIGRRMTNPTPEERTLRVQMIKLGLGQHDSSSHELNEEEMKKILIGILGFNNDTNAQRFIDRPFTRPNISKTENKK